MAHPAPALPVTQEQSAVLLLLAEARKTRDDGNVLGAEALARRARCYEPDSVAAATLQCALLRSFGRIEQALAIGQQFEASEDPELLVERARTMCDLERWEEARRILDALPDAPPALVNRIHLAAAALVGD